ncbi:MAG: helix-turn-helix domain-containing protein [Spirosomataceae bacterium]
MPFNLSNILFFLSTLGWFNGLILCIVFFRKSKLLSNALFGIFLSLLSLRVAKSVLWWFVPDFPIIIVMIGLGICFLIGPVFLFYVIASQRNIQKLPKSWLIVLISHLLLAAIVLVFYSGHEYLPIWKKYIVSIIYYQWMGFTLAAGYQLKDLILKFFKRIPLSINEKWLLAIFFSTFLLVFTYILSYFKIFNIAYITGPLIFTLIIYLNIIIYFNRKNIDNLSVNNEIKYQNKKIDAEEAANVMQLLNEYLTQTEVYKNPELKIQEVAKAIQISSHKLSQILNDNYGVGFPSFINTFRVEASCQLIIEKHQTLTLEAIGKEVGFQSKSTFFTFFKKIKGITPNEFKAQQNLV